MANSSIDAYGDFELPEEKTEIEIVEDPVKKVISVYEFYRKVNNNGNCDYGIDSRASKVYEDLTKLFPEKEKLKLDVVKMKKILNYFRKNAKEQDYTGLFLTFLVNETSLDCLIVDESPVTFTNLGNHLKKDKILFVGEKANMLHLGHCVEGTIINAFNVSCLSYEAEGGMQINYGQAGSFGYKCKNALLITYSKVNLGFGVHDGFAINLSENPFVSYQYHVRLLNEDLPFKQKLYEKLEEIEFLKQLKTAEYDEIAKQLQAFDFKRFEKDIRQIVGEFARQINKI